MRDIEGDYKRAYINEYEAALRAGHTAAAESVARILRDHYGHEVAPTERADESAPEAAVPAPPAKRSRAKKPSEQ